jgi:acyl carrier protein
MLSEDSTVTYMTIILEYVVGEILGDANDLDADTPLLALGIIDSLSMVSVMTFIRERFGVEVPNDAVTVENFESVRAIAGMVERLVLSRAG